MTLERAAGIQTAPVRFLDVPSGFPILRSLSSMALPLKERLRVALHLQAKGVYDILGDAATRQESLWRVVEYERCGDDLDGRYKLARERQLHSQECWAEAFVFHASTGGDRGCTCRIAAGVDHNGIPFDVYCKECDHLVQHRFGSWVCRNHFDRGQVEFRPWTDGSGSDA